MVAELFKKAALTYLQIKNRVYNQDRLEALFRGHGESHSGSFTVSDEDHDKTFIQAAAGAAVATLPRPSDVPIGFRVRVINNADRTGNFDVKTPSGGMRGILTVNAADAVNKNDALDVVRFGASSAEGDYAVFVSNGNNRWFVSGHGDAASSIAFVNA